MAFKDLTRAWYQQFVDYVAKICFTHSLCDHSLFIYHNGSNIAFILLYVDDIVLTASSNSLRLSIAKLQADEFAMKDLGSLSYFFGIVVTRTPNSLFLSQEQYAEEILNRAGMSKCKPCATLVDTKGKLSASEGEPYDDPTKYTQLEGALQYLTFTRPDIS